MLLFIYCGFVEGVVQQIFQNISCYCLSPVTSSPSFPCADFKTSHVIVYLPLWIPVKYIYNISKHLMLLFIFNGTTICIMFWNFKTSHVIVYLYIFLYLLDLVSISKHLMLLFIGADTVLAETFNSIFQNISCYCLSLAFPRFLVSPLPFFPLYFLYFSIFYQPTPLSWTALLIIP